MPSLAIYAAKLSMAAAINKKSGAVAHALIYIVCHARRPSFAGLLLCSQTPLRKWPVIARRDGMQIYIDPETNAANKTAA